MTEVMPALNAKAVLGECPIWSSSRGRLLWVDTLGPTLNLFDPATGDNISWPMPGPVGFVAEDATGNLIAGIGCDVVAVDAEGSARRFATAPHARPGVRLNDARFDRRGRLWLGLMDEQLTAGSGYLYRLDPDGVWHECDSGFTLINGLDWSPDGQTFYLTDSRRGEIYAYDFDEDEGALRSRRVFFQMDISTGKPDGLLVDPHGFILSVLFDGAAILRLTPDGRLDRRFDLPVPRPTSCALSPMGDRLYVTTARLGLSNEDLARVPLSGALLSLRYPDEGKGDG